MFQRVCIVGALMLVVPIFSSGQVIIGNYPPTNDGTQTASVNDQRQKGMRFIMPNQSIIAGELILRLRNYTGFGEVIAELRNSTSDTTPGPSVLLTFTAPSPGGASIQDYTFTPDSMFTLQPNETYWLVVRGIAGGSFDWMASSPGVTPTGLAAWGSSSFTTNGGASWSNSTILTTFEFLVIPAPGVLALLGIASVAGRRRRRA